MKKKIETNKAPQAIGPYSQAIEVAGFLYVSGQIPIAPSTGERVEGIEAETKQVMANLKAILEEANTDFDAVIKCSIFMIDLGDFTQMNEIYGSFFKEGKEPARETIQVVALPKGVGLEISLIAKTKE